MHKLDKLLVANRGEIAVRVMRTAKQMGYRTVAVYSVADQHALHVQRADESVCIGAAPACESYLLADKIIAAAKKVAANAIHPGYGFLSENAEFAEACEAAGIIFVGPPASAIRLMGSKRLSKLAMLASNVPCIPGYQGAEQDDETLLSQARSIGMPLMIKASAGGGGRGMRLVLDPENLHAQLKSARSEALSAFGSDEMIIERALIEPRHIEIQIFADTHGNVVSLGERDCSIQRRHQKVIEESPSPFVNENLRCKMGAAAVNVARACNYVGAGTVEFLVDKQQNFYFLEMNTRLQVEHPVTEMITGQDLVQWQLLIANGQQLPLKQEQIEYHGHAIEVRLYAEDPRKNFIPQTGKVIAWQTSNAANVRNDSGIQAGQLVTRYYDPMLAKVIAWSETRFRTTGLLTSALADTILLGVNNNKQFLQSILALPAFAEGKVTTAFLAQEFPNNEYQATNPSSKTLAVAAILFYRRSQLNPLYYRRGWSSAEPLESSLMLTFEDQDYAISMTHVKLEYRVEVATQNFHFQTPDTQLSNGVCHLIDSEQSFSVHFAFSDDVLYLDHGVGHFEFQDNTLRPALTDAISGDAQVKAPMDGVIVEIMTGIGEKIEAGQVLAVLEAMKMEHRMRAGITGIVAEINVTAGQQVRTQQLIATIVAPE